LAVSRLWCPECDLAIEGRFEQGPLAGLSREQLDFVITFVRCEGKFTRMEREMTLSYPTLRGRLHEIIRALGFEPGAEEATELPPDEETRRSILDDLDAGRIDADTALRHLHGGKKES
jgi:hypothetical protein